MLITRKGAFTSKETTTKRRNTEELIWMRRRISVTRKNKVRSTTDELVKNVFTISICNSCRNFEMLARCWRQFAERVRLALQDRRDLSKLVLIGNPALCISFHMMQEKHSLPFSAHCWRLDQIPMERFRGEGILLDCTSLASWPDKRGALITDRDIETRIAAWEKKQGRKVPKGAILLFNTGWGKHWGDRAKFMGSTLRNASAELHFPGLDPSAGKYGCLMILEV